MDRRVPRESGYQNPFLKHSPLQASRTRSTRAYPNPTLSWSVTLGISGEHDQTLHGRWQELQDLLPQTHLMHAFALDMLLSI